MAKKVWISFPLITSCDTRDASVVTFLKGGQKKELEVETAAFLTKWLMDRDVLFGVDFGSSGVDRALVIELLPKRLQKILGATVPAVSETVDVPQGAQAALAVEAGRVEQVAAGDDPALVEESGAAEEVAETEGVGAELLAGTGTWTPHRTRANGLAGAGLMRARGWTTRVVP